MRWVTYLSPSGGGERLGALDDGDVLGSPGSERLADLLEAGGDALEAAHGRAVDAPIEIIVEPEARMCAPVVPTAPVAVRAGEDVWEVAPELVRGADDAVPSGARSARVGVAAVAGGGNPASAYTPACLWLDRAGRPVQLSLGPVLVTADEVPGRPLRMSASVDDRELGRGLVDPAHAWLASGSAGVRALLPVATPPLEADDELFVDADALGTFEVRVGSQV
ncbi:hypothetical protein A6A08_03875 [Nocardiopsis sp. TSRI0078]|uniref:hypothetical protein n=1 Tax=unclassified Nocardiopsis TaxID=2649073 RepID=UPI00093A2770|nr:hypothetical protein [Nocardiopsis sp. TSRI0078]OKI18775.1 hypothetical protein A6A08_03875 [Nocardiopsis sp. TSRI0078]